MKTKKLELQYLFSEKGITDFASDVFDDVIKALNESKEPDKLTISLGGRFLEITLFAETYEELTTFLDKALKIENE